MKNRLPKMFSDNPFVAAVSIPDIPPQVEVDCYCCDGEGVHERESGNSEDYDCEECNATGRVMGESGELSNTSYPKIEVGGVDFAPQYLRLIKSLPNAQLSPTEGKASPFTFDGGDGLLMPMRKQT